MLTQSNKVIVSKDGQCKVIAPTDHEIDTAAPWPSWVRDERLLTDEDPAIIVPGRDANQG